MFRDYTWCRFVSYITWNYLKQNNKIHVLNHFVFSIWCICAVISRVQKPFQLILLAKTTRPSKSFPSEIHKTHFDVILRFFFLHFFLCALARVLILPCAWTTVYFMLYRTTRKIIFQSYTFCYRTPQHLRSDISHFNSQLCRWDRRHHGALKPLPSITNLHALLQI